MSWLLIVQSIVIIVLTHRVVDRGKLLQNKKQFYQKVNQDLDIFNKDIWGMVIDNKTGYVLLFLKNQIFLCYILCLGKFILSVQIISFRSPINFYRDFRRHTFFRKMTIYNLLNIYIVKFTLFLYANFKKLYDIIVFFSLMQMFRMSISFQFKTNRILNYFRSEFTESNKQVRIIKSLSQGLKHSLKNI